MSDAPARRTDRYIVDALGIAIRNALALLDGLPLTNVVDAGRGY